MNPKIPLKPKHDKNDDEWVRDHFGELVERFPGKYVAVARGRIAAVDKTPLEAERKALRKYPQVLPSVLRVPHPEDLTCAL